MNAVNENVLSMAQTVQQFYVDNQAEADAALPAVAAQITELGNRVTAILLNAAEADQDISGYAQDKKDLADTVIDLAFQVGNACASYFTLVEPSKTMKERVDWTKSELQNKRDNDLYVAAIKTWQIADPIKANLTDYGVTAANVDGFASTLQAYLDIIQTPQQSYADRNALKEDEDKMISDLRQFFSEILDQLFEPIAISNPLLYAKYQASRVIIDLPGGGGGEPFIAAAMVAAGTTANINLPSPAVSISASTPIRLENTGAHAGLVLSFTFSIAPADFGGDAAGIQNLLAGENITKTAEQLGYTAGTRVYLNVRNSTANEQSYSIEI